jgi:N utilization substance protein B
MGQRRKGRELALQALYQQDVSGEISDGALRQLCDHLEPNEAVKVFAMDLVRGAKARRAEIDALIDRVSRNWRLDRLAKVDLSLLRLATFELLGGEVPANIVINEAIEIARRFGTEDSTAFVNGVLDQIAELLGVKPAQRSAAVDE